MDFTHLTFSAAIPEYILSALALVLVLLAAFERQDSPQHGQKNNQHQQGSSLKLVRNLSRAGYVIAFLSLMILPAGKHVLFNGLFMINDLTVYMKGLILMGAFFASLLVSDKWGEGIDRAEFHLLVLLAVLGMLVMVSANNLISLYMGLELQSLPLYVVAAMRTNSLKSSEAGLKYFLLGALSSGLLLYGASLIYGFAGSTDFSAISASLAGDIPVGLTIGMVFLICGIAFKISAAPFHMWTPDVYEGAPMPVTALFAIVPKVAAMTLMMNVTYNAFGAITMQWSQLLIALSVASMIVGATGAIMQQNLKRMLAYSSIAHMGYALAGLAAGTAAGASGVIIYMTIYVFTGAAAFAIVMALRRDGAPVERISDLTGLSSTHPLLAAGMMIVMFSMAGIPPLAGFFGKWFVFLAAVKAGFAPLAIIGVLTSVVAAFYYLRIIKLMYFVESDGPLDPGFTQSNKLVMIVSLGFIVFFFLAISALSQQVDFIVKTLF